MSDQKVFEYKVRFEKRGTSYRLIHYNEWHEFNEEQAFDDIRIMLEGKDLKGEDLSQYKIVDLSAIEDAIYDLSAQMTLYEDKVGDVQQVFALNSLEKVKKDVEN